MKQLTVLKRSSETDHDQGTKKANRKKRALVLGGVVCCLLLVCLVAGLAAAVSKKDDQEEIGNTDTSLQEAGEFFVQPSSSSPSSLRPTTSPTTASPITNPIKAPVSLPPGWEEYVMPNIGFLLRGYDLMKGNPTPTSSDGVAKTDPGFQLPIFAATYTELKKTPDLRFNIPDNVEAVSCSGGCNLNFVRIGNNRKQSRVH